MPQIIVISMVLLVVSLYCNCWTAILQMGGTPGPSQPISVPGISIPGQSYVAGQSGVFSYPPHQITALDPTLAAVASAGTGLGPANVYSPAAQVNRQ